MHPRVRQAGSLERLILFSDAVFAIAITLLVIEIGVPHVASGPHATVAALRALADRIPKFAGYVSSFLVVGAYWAQHDRAFALAGGHGHRLVWPNLHLLLVIAFIPFATAFMSENISQTVPNAFYALTLLAAGLLQARLLRRILADPAPDAEPVELAAMRARSWALPLAACVALALSLVVPLLATYAFLTIPLFMRLLVARAARNGLREAASPPISDA